MKYIEQLLQGAEVEWTTLGDKKFIEIANTSRRPVKASNRIAGNTPYYGANNIQDYVEGYTHDGTYVLVAEDGTTSVENYSVQWATGKFWANNHVHVLRGIDCVNSRFLFHYLRIVDFAPFLTGGGRAKLTKKDLIRIPIPIPPLHVQQEIVRILDKFTELETELEKELETELELRKQQYERYRDQLLAPDKGLAETEVEWKKLGEVCQFKNGFAFKSSLFKGSGLPIIRISNIIGNSVSMNDVAFFDPKDYKKGNPLSYTISRGDILIAMSGATTGKIGYYNNEELAYLNQRVGKFIPNPIILNNRFLYHFLLTQSDYFYRLSLGGAQPNLSSNDLMERILIPIPPLHVQQRIVSLLDKFHTLTTSINEGLPRELELRKQQYAYYRDQLLAFER